MHDIFAHFSALVGSGPPFLEQHSARPQIQICGRGRQLRPRPQMVAWYKQSRGGFWPEGLFDASTVRIFLWRTLFCGTSRRIAVFVLLCPRAIVARVLSAQKTTITGRTTGPDVVPVTHNHDMQCRLITILPCFLALGGALPSPPNSYSAHPQRKIRSHLVLQMMVWPILSRLLFQSMKRPISLSTTP